MKISRSYASRYLLPVLSRPVVPRSARGGALASILLAACGRAELEVAADALPGRYPNQLTSAESELQFALLAPRSGASGSPSAVQEPTGDSPLPAHPNTAFAVARAADGDAEVLDLGPIEWRDVNGDGADDVVARFSVAELRAAGLLHASGSRLRVDAHLGGQALWSGWDRVFAPEAPIVRLPRPAGPFAVGTRSDYLLDPARDRVREPGRPLYVRLWYPAASTGLQPADYFLVPDTARAVAESVGAGPELFDAVHASSLRDAPPAAGAPRATLLLSTGSGVPLDAYAALAEELASQGFLVVGVGHPDGMSGPIAHPNGSVSEDVGLSALDALEPVEEPSEQRRALEEQLISAANLACAGDLLFVLGCLEPGASCGFSSPSRAVLAGADLQRVGALGHSFGGSAAVWADLLSERITASANLDGALWGEPLRQGWPSRVLILQSDELVAAGDESNLSRFLAQSQGTTQLVHVMGSSHMQFSDVELIAAGLPQLAGALGSGGSSLDSLRVLEIQNAYVRAFFAEQLRAEPSALLGGPHPEFPEVSLETRRIVEAAEP